MTASRRDLASSSHEAAAAPVRAPRFGLPPLRGYQEEAVAAIVEGFTAQSRGTVVAACGTGKTLVSAYAAQHLVDEGLVVVACPSLPLIAQTLREFTRFGIAAGALAVCSDDTVADAAVHVSDLPCPVTTDPGRIAAWLRTGSPGERRLMLVTHLSADAAGQGLREAGVAAGLLVVDEAHRTAGWAGKRARFLHSDAGLAARRRLYLTATPRVLTGGGRGPRQDMLSMDDVDTFGRRLYTYPFADAIADGWLDDYRLAVVGITHEEALAALRAVGDSPSADGEDRLIRAAVVQTALARAAVEFGLRRIMVFCPWIRDSQHFAATLEATVARLPADQRPKGRLTSIHVDSTQSNATRQAALDLLAEPPDDGWTVLSNARCLAEGVDVPAVDAVVFTAPKRSQIDIVQAVGRALRRNPQGSGIATILVPVLLPDDPNCGGVDLGEWETVPWSGSTGNTATSMCPGNTCRTASTSMTGSPSDAPRTRRASWHPTDEQPSTASVCSGHPAPTLGSACWTPPSPFTPNTATYASPRTTRTSSRCTSGCANVAVPTTTARWIPNWPDC